MADIFDTKIMKLLKSKNTPDYLIGGKHYEVDRYIINPAFVPDCESKYIIVEGDTIREMTVEEKAVVDYVAPIPDPLPLTAEEIEKKRKVDIAREIALVYSVADELSIHRRLLQGTLKLTDAECVEWLGVIDAAKLKYKKAV